jgi:hypothetical protein
MNPWRDDISHEIDVSKELDADFNFWRSTGYLIGSNRFLVTDPCNSMLPTDMNKHIQRTSRTVETPPIPISTMCRRQSPFNVTFSALKSGS